jgi:hypothetical protein
MTSERRVLPAIVLLVATVLVGHFALVSQFGLYEDDYWSIAPQLNDRVSDLWGILVSNFTTWPTGRPLNHFLPSALSRIGSRFGGLEGAYALAAAWLALNGTLVFLIVRRLMSHEAAVLAALAYLLYPADSTRILLVHAAHVQGAMTFLLLGVWMWLKGGPFRAASYAVASLALLSYETAFIPFLAVPLLRASDRRSTIRTWVVHALSCVAIVALDAAIRFSLGDVRASQAVGRMGESAYRVITSFFLGPWTSGGSLLTAARAAWHHVDALAVLGGAVVVGGFAANLDPDAAGEEPAAEPEPARWPAWLNRARCPGGRLPWWWVLAGAIVVWSASYALTLTNYPPTQTIGRITSTHTASAWPVSLALGALFEGARVRRRRAYRLAAGVAAVWLASMVAYHHRLQHGYARSWQVQKRFWGQVMALAPDAGPGWTVIADGVPAESPPVICANSWADYHAYRLIFTTGYDASGPRFAHLGYLGGQIGFRRAADRVDWKPEFWDGGGPYVPIDPARLVLLHDDHGVLSRVTRLSTPVGELVSTAPPSIGPRRDWPSTPVSRLLFPDRFP